MNIYQYWKNRFLGFNRKKRPIIKGKQKKAYAMIFCALCSIASATSYAGTDTKLQGDDKVSGALPIGFEFNYYGKNIINFM